jgi:hypothetical protein
VEQSPGGWRVLKVLITGVNQDHVVKFQSFDLFDFGDFDARGEREVLLLDSSELW